MRTWHCVNCDTLLVEAPTDKGYMDCGTNDKICFDCIDRMYDYLKLHRNSLKAVERNDSGSVAGEPGTANTARDAIDECYDCLYDGQCVYPRPCVVDGKSCRSTAPIA